MHTSLSQENFSVYVFRGWDETLGQSDDDEEDKHRLNGNMS